MAGIYKPTCKYQQLVAPCGHFQERKEIHACVDRKGESLFQCSMTTVKGAELQKIDCNKCKECAEKEKAQKYHRTGVSPQTVMTNPETECFVQHFVAQACGHLQQKFEIHACRDAKGRFVSKCTMKTEQGPEIRQVDCNPPKCHRCTEKNKEITKWLDELDELAELTARK